MAPTLSTSSTTSRLIGKRTCRKRQRTKQHNRFCPCLSHGPHLPFCCCYCRGFSFLIGLATYDRLSREVIRSSVVSEVAMAAVIAIIIHFLAICLLSTTGFRLSAFVAPLVHYGMMPTDDLVHQVAQRLVAGTLYLGATTTAGFLFGLLVAREIISGPLRRITRHKWIYDIVDADRKKETYYRIRNDDHGR